MWGGWMKAYLIDPVTQFIRVTTIESMDDIKHLIGLDTIHSDEIGDVGDRIYFDEQCSGGSKGSFQIDNLIPVSGKAVIVGTRDNGQILCDANVDMYGLNRRLKYL